MKDKLKRLLRRLSGPLLPGASAGGRRANRRLAVCGDCGSHVVNPVDWHESDEAHWWVRLRCGACGESREVTITDDEATQLERDLAPGLREIATTVAGLDRERMLQEAEIFIAALERDLIGPADFARRLPR
jgi:hypothetical protein